MKLTRAMRASRSPPVRQADAAPQAQPRRRVVQAQAEATLKAVWFRHPSNEAVNDLMRKGISQLQSAASLPAALATFRQATRLDPMFAEAWNKVATVLFLQRKCALAPRSLCTLVAAG